jgi:hypothetical protein
MQSVGRKLAFVLASSNHGTMIVNRFDYRMLDSQRGYGVGYQILETAFFDPSEVKLAVDLLALRRKHHGDVDDGLGIGPFHRGARAHLLCPRRQHHDQ